MKSALMLAGAPLAVIVVIVGNTLAPWSPPQLPQPLQRQQRVYPVASGSVISYIIATPGEPVILVNAGSDPEAKAIRQKLDELRRDPSDVAAILLTHGSYDHWRGIAQFPHATIFASADDLRLLSHARRIHSPVPRIRMRVFGRPASPQRMQTLLPSERLVVGSHHFDCIPMTGVTVGSMAFRMGDIVFLGDTLWPSDHGLQIVPASWAERHSDLGRVLPRLEHYPSAWLATSRAGIVARGPTMATPNP